MASKRRAMSACSRARSAGTSASAMRGPSDSADASRRPCSDEMGCPLKRCTSSARWIRCASVGARRAAVSGSTKASSACSAGQPSLRGPPVEFLAHAGIGARQRRQPFRERLEVQHGATAKDRRAAARANVRHGGQRVAHERRRRIGQRRIDDVEQVMRHARPVGGGRLGGADVHAAIHLRRIDGDDFAVEASCQVERERALARSRRTHQQDGRVHGTNSRTTLDGRRIAFSDRA